MSVTDSMARYQLQQMKVDALNTRTALVTRGWCTGALIRSVHRDGGSAVCMTGAAGCGVEEEVFVDWVRRTGRNIPKGYRWRNQSKALLRLIAEVGHEMFNNHTYAPSTATSAINTIISINDGLVKNQDNAIAWIDAVIAKLDELIGTEGNVVPALFTMFGIKPGEEEPEEQPEEETATVVEDATALIEQLFGDDAEERKLAYQED